MTGFLPIVLFGICLALALNFVNGMNDASHAIATVVATKAISPGKATLLTAIANVIGPFIFTTAVAATIGTEIVNPDGLTPLSIIVAMGAAIILVFAATQGGIPLSSSHALVGGLLGAGIGAAGLTAVILPGWDNVIPVIVYAVIGSIIGAVALMLVTGALEGDRRLGAIIGAICGAAVTVPVLMIAGVLHVTGLFAIVLFIFIGPILGITTAFLFDVLISHLFRRSRQNRMKRIFQPLQVIACIFQAAGHGANDGQHAVGAITALLVSAGILASFTVPTWVILASALAIGIGTLFGGWQVVDKMAKKITKIRPYQGFCAATAGSSTLAMVTAYGVPVSSTQVISGAIIGVGATRGEKAVQWDVVREMMTAWVITIPLAMVVSWFGFLLVSSAIQFFL
jgi:inorganic phosphate transporter, PiT family